jgi:cell wall-associated NlpC family hydrolase
MMKIAWTYLGLPYIWGGDDPIEGFDCSGFAVHLLQSVNLLTVDSDYTAAGLYRHLFEHKTNKIIPGNLIFFGSQRRLNIGDITHVEIAVNGELMIGASGGGRNNMTIEEAVRNNAFIKVKPVKSRRHMIGIIDPFKAGPVYAG